MLFSPQMCGASHPSTPSHPPAGVQPVLDLSRMEVRSQSANWHLCCGKDLLLPAENLMEINLKGLEWDWGEFACISCILFSSSVYSCGCVCVWAWVRNAWPCWEEWLLYSCLVGTMGARAVSLGSCMDDLRRSPSFIKRTPTCRIDLTKNRGGNSSSSVFSDHKSLGGAPPPGKGWHHCQCCGPIGQEKGQVQSPHTYGGGGSRMARKKAKKICASSVKTKQLWINDDILGKTPKKTSR